MPTSILYMYILFLNWIQNTHMLLLIYKTQNIILIQFIVFFLPEKSNTKNPYMCVCVVLPPNRHTIISIIVFCRKRLARNMDQIHQHQFWPQNLFLKSVSFRILFFTFYCYFLLFHHHHPCHAMPRCGSGNATYSLLKKRTILPRTVIG